MESPHPTPTQALPPLPAQPLLIADHPALDFLNSVMSPAGVPLDFLRSPASARDWLRQTLIPGADAASAAQAWSDADLGDFAHEARCLREELRNLLFARQALEPGEALPRDAMDFLNRRLKRSPLREALVPHPKPDAGWQLLRSRDCSTPAGLIAELAARCAELIATEPADQVRKCENPACTLWFNDAKRGPRRRWCSMAICGNRMKVAAHRARHKPG